MAAHQAPPSLGLSRQEHRSGVPLPSLPVSGPKPVTGRNQSKGTQLPHSALSSRAPPGPRDCCPQWNLHTHRWTHSLPCASSRHPGVTTQVIYLQDNPYLSLCFWGSPNEDKIHRYPPCGSASGYGASRSGFGQEAGAPKGASLEACYKLQHFPWLYRLGNSAAMYTVSSLCFSDTSRNSSPWFSSYTWHLTQ